MVQSHASEETPLPRPRVPVSETYDRVQECLLKLLKTQATATTDDVHDRIDIDPRAGKQIGIAITQLAQQRLIVAVGRRPSRRVISHGREIKVWALPDRN